MSDVNAALLQGQVNDLQRKNDDLVKDNGKQRDQIRDLEGDKTRLQGEVDGLKEKVPADGAIILTTDADKKRYKAFLELGDGDTKGDPEKIAAQLSQASKDAQSLRRSNNQTAIEKLGFKKSLLRLPEFGDVDISIEEEDGEDDEKLLKGVVKTASGNIDWKKWLKENDLTDTVADFAAADEGGDTSTSETIEKPKVMGQPGRKNNGGKKLGGFGKYIEAQKKSSDSTATTTKEG